MPIIVLLRGGGDLASGVALRLHRAGLRVLITELPQPLVVRRLVSFAEAIYTGEFSVEGVTARLVEQMAEARAVMEDGQIPVMIDPHARVLEELRQPSSTPDPVVLVDGRMIKRPPDLGIDAASLVIGLGPGYIAGVNCHAVIETNRGHHLGRVLWDGAPEADTGIPESVNNYGSARVLRAPAGGLFRPVIEIGEPVAAGQLIAEVSGSPIHAPFKGVIRGLIHAGLHVSEGTKVGDVDPRGDPRYSRQVSDKSLAIGGAVLEAILSRQDLRPYLWG